MSKNAILVTDHEGVEHLVIINSIKGVEHVAGRPGVAAVPAKKAVEGHSGVPATPGDPHKGIAAHPGSPPVEGQPETEEVKAIPAVPDSSIVHTDGESIPVVHSMKTMLDMINSN